MSDQFDAKAFLKTVTSQPGVYRMYDAGGTVIYVGKAKDLKKRLSSYFRSNLASRKTEALVAQIQQIDVTVTHTETEALLLEHNYIKLYQPRYNVLLRDDKSYPFIFLSGDTHPRLAMHRGAKHAKGEYFGPFPNGYAVRETLALLQKIFPIRQCENSVYRNRSRPCLQYQIGRCLGPCVEGLVSEEEYAALDAGVRNFEPRSALVPGPQGLEHPRAVEAAARALLKEGGLFLMEHGHLQGEACRALCPDAYWTDVRTGRDLAGKDRFLSAVRRSGV